MFPKPGEVRFFEGNTRYLPHMIWQYKEPRCVTGVSILPVPLSTNESYPCDMNVSYQFYYYFVILYFLVYLITLKMHVNNFSKRTVQVFCLKIMYNETPIKHRPRVGHNGKIPFVYYKGPNC